MVEPGQILLKATGLEFAYSGRPVLLGVDLEVRTGEMLGILGPNGSGKSTMLGLLAGLTRPRRGKVELKGADISRLGRKAIAAQVGLTPQNPELAPGLTVMETVLAGRFVLMSGRQFESETDLAAARQALAQTGMTGMERRRAAELSGGERQRLALARALAARPGLLLLDEPTSALDLDHQMGVMGLLERSCRAGGVGVCLVSHDLNLASLFCDRLLLLGGGRVLACGPPEEVLTPELLRRAYGVEVAVDREPGRGRPRVTPLPPAMA